MFPIKKENIDHLQSHNIRISELNPSANMSQPRKIIHLPKVRMLNHGSPSIRITNVKSVKPDPEFVKRQEEERLRAQLQKEIVSRSRTCAYHAYECTLPVVGGRMYCGRHILSDPTAPYKQCAHVSPSGTRCGQPAPLEREPGVCFEHARSALRSRTRAAAPPAPAHTPEALLHRLQHYVRPERPRTTSCASSVSVVSDPADQDVSPHALDPFKEMDAVGVNAAASAALMECVSASDSDCDSVVVERSVAAADTEDAPAEDAPLWKAGVYTAEEAVSEAKNVLRSLQGLYVQQMSRLRERLQRARRRYLRALRLERDHCCSINSQSRSGPLSVLERRQLRKLKAYAGYHRRHGADAVLARKLHHKRAMLPPARNMNCHRPEKSLRQRFSGDPPCVRVQGRCVFTEGGVRCDRHALPAARHCRAHILHDTLQVLFVSCGDARGPAPCREPAARSPLPRACRYHTDAPTHACFAPHKQDSDSDSESMTSDLSPNEVPSPGKREATEMNIPETLHCD